MKLKRKALSDEEYVERVRKCDRTFRRMRWIWPLLFLLNVCCLILVAGIVPRILVGIPNDKSVYYYGLLLGAIFGALFLMIAAHSGLCIKQWNEARSGFRTERLLLQFHDKLNDRGISNKSVQATGEAGRA